MFTRQLDAFTQLRLLTESDAEALFALTDRNRGFLRRSVPWVDNVKTKDDSARFIRESVDLCLKQRGLQAGIWHNGGLCGVTGLIKIDGKNRKGAMGYWLSEQRQGLGLMTRACKTILEFGFHDLGLNRVSIRCPSKNPRARKLAERLGFKVEGELKEAEWFYDHFEDNVLYGLLAGDFQIST